MYRVNPSELKGPGSVDMYPHGDRGSGVPQHTEGV